MRIPLKALICGVAALCTALLSSPASATPVPKGKAALVDNPIYKTGKLELKECPEQPVPPDDYEGARVYLEFVLECLDKSWAMQFEKAGLPFSKPKFKVTANVGSPIGRCGKFPRGAQAVYCPADRTMTVLLDKGVLVGMFQADLEPELYLFTVLAHEYGHHVQNLTGMMDVIAARKYKDDKAFLPDLRRMELQADCLGAAFIGSVWRSLGRSDYDFRFISEILMGGVDSASHGKGSNAEYWLKRGWNGEAPGSCNTWSAPKSKVS
ncbi:neutral zinc metallopeptidase [Thermoactinospora rubra]|uniref:neutral zinc metallopeptidase n=1 Tax=Thermoactinospora rubra TaxID=1088767 RepID=UPI000A0F82DB|nr:neutral zinc metallopeptidase [Thermoactinospora rubra]